MAKLLIVDDDRGTVENLVLAARDEGYEAVAADNTKQALASLKAQSFDAVVTDMVMPDGSGMDILAFILRRGLSCPVVIMTGFATVPAAVGAMRSGAFDYLTKPVDLDELFAIIERCVVGGRGNPTETRRQSLVARYGAGRIVGGSQRLLDVFEQLDMVADTSATVLITGESGTGKELIADALHHNSPRAGGPYVKVNCMAFAEGILESELFGHEKGAFTSAHRRHTGRFEAADGGTLFLDEVGDLSLPVQLKLLRVLQERSIERVGGGESIPVDVRLIFATNQDLEDKVATGAFREELYYRINVVQVALPALRERADDIPVLVEHFLHLFAGEHGKRVASVTQRAMAKLRRYNWPGNIRELRNVVENLVLTTRGPSIDVPDLPSQIRDRSDAAELVVPVGTRLDDVEEDMIQRTLAAAGGNKALAARMLGMSLRTLYRRIAKYETKTKAGAKS